VYFVECLGDYDYELGAEVHQPEHVLSITRSLFKQFRADFLNITVVPQFRYLKYQPYPFSEGELSD